MKLFFLGLGFLFSEALFILLSSLSLSVCVQLNSATTPLLSLSKNVYFVSVSLFLYPYILFSLSRTKTKVVLFCAFAGALTLSLSLSISFLLIFLFHFCMLKYTQHVIPHYLFLPDFPPYFGLDYSDYICT